MKNNNKCALCHSRSEWELVVPTEPEYDGSWQATCNVYGHKVVKYCRGCARCEKDPAKAIMTPPARPLQESAVKNVYNHDCNIYTFKIETMQVLGDWFWGLSFSMRTDDMRGWGAKPCVYDTPFQTERAAIEACVDGVIRYIKGHPKEAQAVEALRNIKAEQRQLTLF